MYSQELSPFGSGTHHIYDKFWIQTGLTPVYVFVHSSTNLRGHVYQRVAFSVYKFNYEQMYMYKVYTKFNYQLSSIRYLSYFISRRCQFLYFAQMFWFQMLWILIMLIICPFLNLLISNSILTNARGILWKLSAKNNHNL
jgi:hypothetical protein